jgi:hypothetical protein
MCDLNYYYIKPLHSYSNLELQTLFLRMMFITGAGHRGGCVDHDFRT